MNKHTTNGQIAIAKRVRVVLEAGRPNGAIILTEGTADKRQGLFEFIDGSLEWGPYSFTTRWLWDAPGQTDTFVPGFSVDDWHQVIAIGAKLACPYQYLKPPPDSSATDFLNRSLAPYAGGTPFPDKFDLITMTVMWGLHSWRNAGLMMGLPMPSFGDLAPKQSNNELPLPMMKTPGEQFQLLERMRPRAACIDNAFAGRRPTDPAVYLKTLLTARRELSRIIDHGSTVTQVNSGSAQAAAWRFASANGIALSAVNVADDPCQVVFQNAPGTWTDAVTGAEFTARGGALSVSVPAHRVRLVSHDPCQSIRNQIQNLKCDTSQPNAKACEIQARELNLKLQACEKNYEH